MRIRPVRLQSAGLGGMLLNGGTNDQHVGVVLRHTGSFIGLLFGLILPNLNDIDQLRQECLLGLEPLHPFLKLLHALTLLFAVPVQIIR